jgi:hypothetical protein
MLLKPDCQHRIIAQSSMPNAARLLIQSSSINTYVAWIGDAG